MIALLIAAGLASRGLAPRLPSLIGDYLPDALWAGMMYWIVAWVLPRGAVLFVATTALAIAFFVEVSQLYHAPWIDRIRAVRLGGLILGFGFLWTDLLCYTAGVVVSAAIDYRLRVGRLPD